MPAVLDEQLLDDPDQLSDRDTDARLRRTATAGAQVRETSALSEQAGVLRLADGGVPRAVLVAGDGEAAQLAPMLAALVARRAPAPVLELRGGSLPAWVGAPDLVVVAGLGPLAAEGGVLGIADGAARRGAALLGIGRPSGPLHERCARARAPYVALPPDRMEGSALWSLLTPVLLLARRLGMLAEDLDGVPDALDAAAELCRPDSESFVNPAKSLALAVGESLPMIVADSPSAGAAASRLRADLAGHVGLPASVSVLPEDLGEVSACLRGPLAPEAQLQDIFRDRLEDGDRRLRLVAVRDERDPAGGQAMREVLRRADHAGVPVSELVANRPELVANGPDPLRGPGSVGELTGVAGLIALADFSAVYLRLALTGLPR